MEEKKVYKAWSKNTPIKIHLFFQKKMFPNKGGSLSAQFANKMQSHRSNLFWTCFLVDVCHDILWAASLPLIPLCFQQTNTELSFQEAAFQWELLHWEKNTFHKVLLKSYCWGPKQSPQSKSAWTLEKFWSVSSFWPSPISIMSWTTPAALNTLKF